jgi:hypothetical protein
MNNEIPHINPSSGYANKRFYKGSIDKDSLTDSERELFECSEFICGKLSIKKISDDSGLIIFPNDLL